MRIHTLFLSVLCILLHATSAECQSISDVWEMADLQFKHGKYQEALKGYLKVQKEKPDKVDIKYKMGVCYFELGQIQNAEQYLSFVAAQKNGDQDAWYYLGRIYHLQGAYAEAIRYYKKYLTLLDDRSPERGLPKHYILQCASAMKLKYLPSLAVVDNLGDNINGEYDDYAPVISKGRENTIYFSSVRRNNIGGLRNELGAEDEALGKYNSDIFSSELVNGAWSAAKGMGTLINSTRDDQVYGFNADARVMYYYKGYHPLKDGSIYTDTLRNTEEIVFPSQFKSPINLRAGDDAPFYFNDSIIIYAAEKDGGYGGLDLYVIMRLGQGIWTRPQNLGPNINGPYDENYPFLCKDGRTLYFSSNTTESMGCYDIFRSTFRDDRMDWTEPENLGAPINSTGNDIQFRMAKDGLKSYFVSDRIGGRGGLDIYTAYFKAERKEQLAASNPAAFNLVGKALPGGRPPGGGTPQPVGNPSTSPAGEDAITMEIASLFYEGDDILSPANIVQLDKVMGLARDFPRMKVELTGHTDDSDPDKFRLYFSMIRAGKAAEYLRKQGMPAKNIIVKGLGDNYPLAKNKLPDGKVSTTGQTLNRRIGIRLLYLDPQLAKVTYQKPEVHSQIKEHKGAYYESSLSGLSYRVQVAALKNMYDSDIITTYSDPMAEKDSSKELVRYSVGLYRSYTSAYQLQSDLRRKGVAGAFVVPYIDGVRLNPSSVEAFAEKYPDLQNYLRGQ